MHKDQEKIVFLEFWAMAFHQTSFFFAEKSNTSVQRACMKSQIIAY